MIGSFAKQWPVTVENNPRANNTKAVLRRAEKNPGPKTIVSHTGVGVSERFVSFSKWSDTCLHDAGKLERGRSPPHQ